jgi:hypothetical protein
MVIDQHEFAAAALAPTLAINLAARCVAEAMANIK